MCVDDTNQMTIHQQQQFSNLIKMIQSKRTNAQVDGAMVSQLAELLASFSHLSSLSVGRGKKQQETHG